MKKSYARVYRTTSGRRGHAMAIFTYVAMDSGGKEVSGQVEAETVNLAVAQIREQGYYPTKVSEKKQQEKKQEKPGAKKAAVKKKGGMSIQIKLPGMGGRIKSRDMSTFTRQLATLIDAGLPLLRSINVLSKQQKDGTLKDILSQVGEDVEGGSTFSEALAKHPRSFTRLYVNMIKAGEAGGVLETVLNRLAEFAEKEQALGRKIKAAMVYPCVVMVAAVGIVFFLVKFIVPTFAGMFEGLGDGGELPAPTRLLMGFSEKMGTQWYVPLVAIAFILISFKLINRTRPGHYIIDKVKLKMLVFGPLASKMAIARFARTLGTLISSGVPILQALVITKDTSGNEVLARAVASVHDSIREGESIAPPLEQSGVFPSMVTNMIDVGEETGSLDTMLTKVADTYDDEVDTAVEGLTAMLEPIMLIGMGFMVGFIVVALFLPLIKLGGMIGE